MQEALSPTTRRYGGRFVPEQEIGHGGMGTVYRARDEKTGGLVALKVLHEREGTGADRFGQEAGLLAELRHPAIVRYLDHGTTPAGEHFLAMEWLDGRTLEERLGGGALTILESVALGARVLDALVVAHRRGVVHRDLKPSNLFLVGDRLDQTKLLDFGIARRIFDGRGRTRGGAAEGTPMYMAPEQARGEVDIDGRADVFSLGCVIFECLTGRPPFIGETALAVLAKICLDHAIDVAKACPGLPSGPQQSLTAMLARDREQRPGETAALARLFATAEAELRQQGHRLGQESPTRAPRRTPTDEADPRLTPGEQRLFSVVMVSPLHLSRSAGEVADPRSGPAGEGADPRSGAAAGEGNHATGTYASVTLPTHPPGAADALRAPPAGAPPLDLRDDAVLARLRHALTPFSVHVDRLVNGALVVTQSVSGGTADQAANIARTALTLKTMLPAAALAVCTARADGQTELPIGPVLERAGWLVLGANPGQVRLDDVSAELLDARFEIARDRSTERVLHNLLFEKGLREPPRTVLGRQIPCVGRDRELRSLEALFDEVVSEPVARALIVTAPAGGGKSRVRHEFTERILARRQRFEHLIARGDSLRAGAPFGLLGGALRAAANIDLGHHEPPEVRRKRLFAHCARNLMAGPVTLDTAPIEVRRLVAFLGEICDVRFPDDGDPQLLAARADPRLMADQTRLAFLDYMDAETKAGPVVLVFEDLHWGDAPSVQLVDAALRTLADRPLLVVGFARPTVEDTFPGLWQERGVEKLALPPLTSKAAHKLAQAAIEGLTEEQAARVVERADGNPFFLEELLRVVAEKGSLADEGAPVTVLATVQARFDGVGEEGKRVLRAASVFGQTFRRAGVSVLLGEGASRDLGAWLDILTQREIVFPRSAGGAREFGFRHALLRDAAYDLLTPGDRKVGHHLAGEWLEKESDTEAIVLVEHFERAEELTRAAHFCRVAAEQAFGADDLPGTIARAERGVKNGAAGEELGLLRLVEGKARYWRGDYSGAESSLRDVATLLRGTSSIEAVSFLVDTFGQLGRPAESNRLALELLVPTSDRSSSWAEGMLQAATWSLWSGNKKEAERLMSIVESSLVADEARGALLSLMGHLASAAGIESEAAIHYLAAGTIFDRKGDRRRSCSAHVNSAISRFELGDTRAAIESYRDARSRAVSLGLSTMVPTIDDNLAEAYFSLGMFKESRHVAIEALVLAAQQGDVRVQGLLECRIALVDGAVGNFHTALERAATARSHLTSMPAFLPFPKAVTAHILLASGEVQAALEWSSSAYAGVAAGEHLAMAETFVRLVHCESLAANSKTHEARSVIASAMERIREVSRRIMDSEERQRFLWEVRDNKKTADLYEALFQAS